MEKLLKMCSITVILTLISVSAFAETKVIYGDDNREDVYASQNQFFVNLSQATAAMISKRDLKKPLFSKKYTLSSQTFKDRMKMCDSERFIDQPAAANCSGFLVGDKYLVTAGHCIKNDSDCSSYLWLFDFKMEDESKINMNPDEKNIYSCKKVIKSVLNNMNKDDYALIELDRAVEGRQPAVFRKSGEIDINEELVVIGHPSGLPTKIADGANVISKSGRYFSANLDTYGGNSGSAVFNARTGEVEGILVRGATDYLNQGGCRVSNRLPDTGVKGEDVTFITNIKELENL
jgi:V8-like Glu-specific endopeptidase